MNTGKTTKELLTSREVTQLAQRIDRLHPHPRTAILIAKLERLLIEEGEREP